MNSTLGGVPRSPFAHESVHSTEERRMMTVPAVGVASGDAREQEFRARPMFRAGYSPAKTCTVTRSPSVCSGRMAHAMSADGERT